MVCPTLSGPMPGSQVGHLCHRCGRIGHFERYCPALSGPFPGDQVGPGTPFPNWARWEGSPVALPKCQKCGGAGHFERSCPALSGPLPGAWAGPGTPFPDFSEPAATAAESPTAQAAVPRARKGERQPPPPTTVGARRRAATPATRRGRVSQFRSSETDTPRTVSQCPVPRAGGEPDVPHHPGHVQPRHSAKPPPDTRWRPAAASLLCTPASASRRWNL